MECFITYDRENILCVARGSGLCKRPEDSIKIFKDAIAFGLKHNCSQFLFDMRNTTIVGGPIDTFYMAHNPEEIGAKRNYRFAAVYSDDLEQHRFLETVVQNRGFYFRVFNEIDEAIIYLTAK